MDVLTIVAKLEKYKLANYLRPYYLEELKALNKYALHQLPVDVALRIIDAERQKAICGYNKELQQKINGLTLDQKINSPHYWASVKHIFSSRKKLASDAYMVSVIIENLQEYDDKGENITYKGF